MAMLKSAAPLHHSVRQSSLGYFLLAVMLFLLPWGQAQGCSGGSGAIGGDGTGEVIGGMGTSIEGATTETCAANLLIPQGRKFIYISGDQFRQQVQPDSCSGGRTCNSTLTLTVGGAVVATDSYDGLVPPPAGLQPPWRQVLSSPPDIFWGRRFEKIIDVSAFTQNGPYVMLIGFSMTGGNYVQSVGIQFSVQGDIRFRLSQGSKTFLPRDSSDLVTSDCLNQETNCFPKLVARFTKPELKLRIRFLLERANEHGSAIGYRKGSSTNFGDSTGPDMIFEEARNAAFDAPSANGLSVRTASRLGRAEVTVSSRDYGAAMMVRADATLDGVTIKAEIEDVLTEANVTPPPCAGDGDFASLPIDEDCNLIADEWERSHAQRAGLGNFFPSTNWDEDFGALGLQTLPQHRGDGFPVHDEYRGFHYVQPDGVVRHVRTDPVLEQDVFYWDGSASIGSVAGPFTTALSTILFDRVGPGIRFRLVNATLGRVGMAASNPTASVSRFNENSRFSSARLTAYALAYTGRNTGAVCSGPMATSNVLFMRSPRPIEVFPDVVSTCAGNNVFPLDTLLAFVLAHETGHRLGLDHYQRGARYNGTVPPPFTTVIRSEYVVDPIKPTELYNRPGISQRFGGVRLLDRILMTGAVLVGNSLVSLPALVGSPSPNAVTWPVKFTLLSPVSISGSMGTVFFEVIRNFIMDWVPSYDTSMISPPSWQFSPASPDDYSRMCVSCAQ